MFSPTANNSVLITLPKLNGMFYRGTIENSFFLYAAKIMNMKNVTLLSHSLFVHSEVQ